VRHHHDPAAARLVLGEHVEEAGVEVRHLARGELAPDLVLEGKLLGGQAELVDQEADDAGVEVLGEPRLEVDHRLARAQRLHHLDVRRVVQPARAVDGGVVVVDDQAAVARGSISSPGWRDDTASPPPHGALSRRVTRMRPAEIRLAAEACRRYAPRAVPLRDGDLEEDCAPTRKGVILRRAQPDEGPRGAWSAADRPRSASRSFAALRMTSLFNGFEFINQVTARDRA